MSGLRGVVLAVAGGVCLAVVSAPRDAAAQGSGLRQEAQATLEKAAAYYRTKVATRGGYVYHYTLDFKVRWGEGLASENQIWVQPPATPTVGMAYLAAWKATGDQVHLDAATAAAEALIHGQLKSGAWTNAVDFDPRGSQVAQYRNGKGKGRNFSTLDDGISESAIRLMVQADQAHEFRHKAIHESAMVALDALLAAQYPNGGFPQGWDETPAPHDGPANAKGNFPDYDYRTEGRVKNYWDMYTLNDNVTGYTADALTDAWNVYKDERYLNALKKLGDFLMLAQMPEPQPGWAQQYNLNMQPIWARKFEPPGVSGDETQETIETLLKITQVTGDKKYLEPVPAALAWLKRSQLKDGRIARYYELKTNRPLYMERSGDKYSLTYDDSRLPSHYGWKAEPRMDALQAALSDVKAGRAWPVERSMAELEQEVRDAVEGLDRQGRWVSTFAGEGLVGQPKFRNGDQYLASGVFSERVEVLSEYLRRVGK